MMVMGLSTAWCMGSASASERALVIEHACHTFDPLSTLFTECNFARRYISTPLFYYSEKVDGLDSLVAEQVVFDNDAATLDFYLNPAVKWSDGEPVVAEDYLLTLQRANEQAALQGQVANILNWLKEEGHCLPVNASACLHGVTIKSPYHLQIRLKMAPSAEVLKLMGTNDLLPTPTSFWGVHKEETYTRKDLPTYGVYKIDSDSYMPGDLINQTLRFIPDPLSVRPQLQHYSSITAMRRVGWKGKRLRERLVSGTLPDLIFNISGGMYFMYESVLQNGWKIILDSDYRNTLSALLDQENIEPKLKEALILLLDSNEFVSRFGLRASLPAYQLAPELSDETGFVNRYRIQNRGERLQRAKVLLEEIGITSDKRRALNLIYDLPALTKVAANVKSMLKPFGIDVTTHFFADFYSPEFEQFRQSNLLHIELLSWISRKDSMEYMVSMAQVSVLNLLTDEEMSQYQALSEKVLSPENDSESIKAISALEEMLVNGGKFVVLSLPQLVNMLAHDLCIDHDSPDSRDSPGFLVPCRVIE